VKPAPGKASLIWPLAAFPLYALAYFALLYHPLLVRYDDFGYLNGVIETLAAARPRTDAWLEPYTATMSSLCALAFRITGDFPLSTWGLQSAFVLLNFALAYRLLRGRLPSRDAAVLTLFAATQPIYWYKCAEFGGNAFTFAFVLAALVASLRGRWIPFFAAAFLAFANRQNGIVLLILPAFAFFQSEGDGSTRPGDTHTRRTIAIGFCAFAAAAVILHLGMNTTPAQAQGIYAGLDGARLRNIAQTLATGVFIGLGFLSGFAWLLGSDARGNLRANLRRPRLPAAATLILLSLPILGRMPLVEWQAPLIASLDQGHRLQYLFLAVAAPLLWILDRKVLRFDAPLCLCAGFIAINALKGRWFDIYMLDVGLAALFTLLARRPAWEAALVVESDPPHGPGRLAWAAWVVISLAIAANLVWAYGFKILADKNRLSNRVYEGLERRGRIGPDAITDATFGHIGWKFLDHYLAHDPQKGMSGFVGYVKKDKVVLDTELPWRRSFKRAAPAGAETLEAGIASIGFFPVAYRVMDMRTDLRGEDPGSISPLGALELDKGEYRKKPMPLDKAEWSEYIRERMEAYGRKGTSGD
jgi:hypothetical protein